MNQTELIVLMEYQGDVLVDLVDVKLNLAVGFLDQYLQLICLNLLLRLCFNQRNLLLIFVQIEYFSV